jgi:DUF3014 family protein
VEQWSPGDDRPYLRPERSVSWWNVLPALLLLAIAVAAYYLWQIREPLSPEPPPFTSQPRSAEAPPVAAEQAVPGPFDGGRSEAARSLPALEHSDAMMRDTVSGLVGRKAFEALVYPSQIIRRVVATVDNLPRDTAPRRVMPLEPVPGRFIARSSAELTIDATNAARYAAYVRVFGSLDAHTVVERYVESYPLFQRAYAELGFPNLRFNDRLLEAIDDLLAAPELAAPIKLVQPKVHYQFADPELESLSAGQKIMLRMGAENAATVKAKLREIRRELTAR